MQDAKFHMEFNISQGSTNHFPVTYDDVRYLTEDCTSKCSVLTEVKRLVWSIPLFYGIRECKRESNVLNEVEGPSRTIKMF